MSPYRDVLLTRLLFVLLAIYMNSSTWGLELSISKKKGVLGGGSP